MRGLLKKTVDLLKGRHNREIERNIITYGICLIIATILWFLNTLNKEYTTKITYPVKYADLPKGKLLISELPKEMTLEIKAHGFALLRYQISTSFLPIVFNVNTYTNGAIEKKDLTEYTVNLADIKDKISTQLNNDLNLISIEPSSIHFQFSKFKNKTVPIIPRVNYTLKSQYLLKNPISVTPKQLTISGPAAVIDTLKALYTEIINLKEISKDITKTVSIEEVPGIQLDDEDVKIKIEVERSTEAKKNIPLVIRNLSDSLKLQLFPNSVDVTFEVGLSRYDQIADTSFILSVDYIQIKNSPDALSIKVEKQPAFIQNLIYSPEKVEYLIEKK